MLSMKISGGIFTPMINCVMNLLDMGYMSGTLSWDERGIYNWPSLTQRLAEHMEKYVI